MGNSLFSTKPRRKVLVFLEGNISAGKSTIIGALKNMGYPVWEEAVNSLTKEYVDGEGRNILDLYYKDMKSYAFKLQMASLNTRWSIIKEALNHLQSPETQNEDREAEIVFVERSLSTDPNTFALHLRENKLIDELDWKIYMDSVSNKTDDVQFAFDGIEVYYFYLRAEPTECDVRRISRGRTEESNIPLQYLQDIHAKHEAWLNDGNTAHTVIIDANKELADVVAQVSCAVANLL